MNWLERLNQSPGQIALGQGTAELLQWAYAPHLPDNRLHRHTFFEVCQVGRYGQGVFTVGETRHPLTPGDVFIARPGIVHQIVNTLPVQGTERAASGSPRIWGGGGEPASDMELRWVWYQWLPPAGEPSEVDVLLRVFADSPIVIALDDGGRIAALWSALEAVASGPIRLGYEVQAASLISSLLIAIAQAAAGPPAPQATEPAGADAGDVAARQAIRYIHDNLNRPLPLSEIAVHIHTSPRHLSRLFARFAGTAPAAYITHARIDRARSLLRHTQMPIKEVAAAVGYPDVHHFTRVFAQQVGCPPGAYRESDGADYVPNLQSLGALF